MDSPIIIQGAVTVGVGAISSGWITRLREDVSAETTASLRAEMSVTERELIVQLG